MPGARWTPAELHQLRELIKMECSRQEVADTLGRTLASVHLQARHLGLYFSRKRTQRRPWTADDDKQLLYHAATMTRKQLAKKLGRTEASVGKRARQLGIRLSQGRVTMAALARELGVSKITVVRVRDKLGLNFRRYPSKVTSRTKAKGAEPEDVVAIARYLIENSTGPLQTTRKRLREVIAAYGGEEEAA